MNLKRNSLVTTTLLLLNAFLLANSLQVNSGKPAKSNQIETNKYKLHQKKLWLNSHLSKCRQKRQVIYENNNINNHPCPANCSCSYDAISCKELITSCTECAHWHEINFNKITELKPGAFKDFKFAASGTTNIIIYNLVNSSVTKDVFKGLVVPENSHLEITFQYNSVITFDKHVLNGVNLKRNSTLVFNFPYTTQVIFVSKCFDGIQMDDPSSKLIMRVLKSFSVRFVNDYTIQAFMRYKQQITEMAESKNMTFNEVYKKRLVSYENPEQSISEPNSQWTLERGQLIIDIKSTHLVKFEEYSLAYMKVRESAKFYLDMDLIEKLMIQRNSFSHINIDSGSKLTVYGHHLTFIDFRAYSFSSITLASSSRMQVYLDELLHSLCVQRNVFDSLVLNEHSHFNFSVINSKNIMLMHNSFSNVCLNAGSARLYIGVYNQPSFQLSLKNKNNYYNEFIQERIAYKATAMVQPWSDRGNSFNRFLPYSEYYSNSMYEASNDLRRFYKNHKQAYAYNVSIERDCFSQLAFNFNEGGENVWIVADNVNTLLVDDSIVTSLRSDIIKNFNFLANVKNFIMSPESFSLVNQIKLEFLNQPSTLRFGGRVSQEHNIILKGLELNRKSEIIGQDIFDPHSFIQDTQIESICELASMSSNIVFSIIGSDESKEDYCSCDTVYLLKNQMSGSKQIPTAPCKLSETTINVCEENLKNVCLERPLGAEVESHYVKFWEYCISEVDSEVEGGKEPEQGNYYINNLDDPDGLFSASHSLFDKTDGFHSSNSRPGHPETAMNGDGDGEQNQGSLSTNITSIGKIVGTIIVVFLIGIILFMIIINIVQYKFRTELLEELDYRDSNLYPPNGTIGKDSEDQQSRDPNSQNFWKKTFSANSLRRTISVASLRAKQNRAAKTQGGTKNSTQETKPNFKHDSEDDSDADDSEVIKLNVYELRQAEGDDTMSNDSSDDEGVKYSKEQTDLRLKTNRPSQK